MLTHVDDPSPARRPPSVGLEGDSRTAPSEIPLEGLRRLVATSRTLLAAAALAGGVLGGLLMSLQPVRYDAVATLAVSHPRFPPDGRPINASRLRALLGTNRVASSTIQQFRLDASPYDVTPDTFLRDTLFVEQVPGTNLLRVRVRMTNPRLAADVANFVAAEAITLNEAIAQRELLDFRLHVHVDEAGKYESTRPGFAGVNTHVELIDRAIVPTVPLPRHHALGVIVGALAGFTLALLVLATREFLTLPA